MAVVSVVSVLLVLSVPALTSVRDSAQSMQCTSQLKQMTLLVASYSEDFGYLPSGWEEPNPSQHWTMTLTQQANGLPIEYDAHDEPTGSNLPIFECPSAVLPNVSPNERYSHYSCHKVLMRGRFIATGWTGPKYRPDQIRRPNEVILLADGVQTDTPSPTGRTGHAAFNFRQLTPNPLVFFDPTDPDIDAPVDESAFDNTDTQANHGYIRYRHFKDTATNVAFVDGHVASIQRGQILNRNVRINR